jgi:lipoprotein-anchoring transpeptidase ErfK/SrfK
MLMMMRLGGIALAAGLIGFSVVQAAAQAGYPYPPRAAEGYADEPPPGYYQRVPRGSYRRLPPGYYDNGEAVVIDRRGRRAYLYDDDYPIRPDVRRDARAVPGPYFDPNDPQPRPYFRGRDNGRFEAEERRAAVPPAAVPRSGGLFQAEPLAPDSQVVPSQGEPGQSATPADLPPRLRRQIVEYPSREPAGTIVVDTRNTYLYYVLGGGQAVRYGIGVGREGFTWSGREKISRMAEWPDWHPPKEMIARQPYLPRMMAGGPGNPLGARALYLGNTLYRIHGTNEPATIGQTVSSGCIRLLNADIEDLYSRVKVGTRVVVLRGGRPPAGATARR